jgi:hypothetical protein
VYSLSADIYISAKELFDIVNDSKDVYDLVNEKIKNKGDYDNLQEVLKGELESDNLKYAKEIQTSLKTKSGIALNFKESESVIKNNFKPNKNLFEKILKTPFIDTNTVSLHVRRTDYVTSNGYHPVQSIEYYKNAIDIIGDYDYIFVFSDDIQWCKDNLKFKNMVFMEGFSDIEDLHIMSLCQNNIIANSSFSWWGAWLNIHPEKKIIAPTNWFGEQANLNTSDMIPSDWIKINN